MSFGEEFGKLVKKRRGIEGLTQQALAVTAFGEEAYKTRISELENGKVARPQPKTIDALVVALNISDDELSAILNNEPHPRLVDTMFDYFNVPKNGRLDVEVATNADGRAVFFHNHPLRVKIRRIEFFVEDRMLVCLEDAGTRRPTGLPLGQDVTSHLQNSSELLFVLLDDVTGEAVEGEKFPLKIIH